MRGYSASVVAGLVTICLTAALSDAVYRLVERPFIQFGKRFRKSVLAFYRDEESLKFGA
jgi:peptidoglycan/LPS O-acetylase OafA/YrhL